MIAITDSAACCGCTACVNVCPVQCIVMRRDREGFDYPLANPDRCIGCGRCEAVCPVLNPLPERVPQAVTGGRSEEFVGGSASGGIFPHVARKIIGVGGTVFGAVMESDMSVAHCEADDMGGIMRFRGPKYVQSELYAAFEDVRERLAEGREVLFAGTPCQVAGLNRYLGVMSPGLDTSALVTVDFACHGVPGPGLWDRYVKDLERKYGSRMTGASFRDKERSWFHYDVKYDFSPACASSVSGISGGAGHEAAGSGDPVRSSVRREYMADPYMALFVQDLTMRPSCYACPARRGRSGSDLTLGDLWSVKSSMPRLDDDKGAGLVLVFTEKGRELLEGLDMEDLVPESALGNNGGFAGAVDVPACRQEFFDGLDSAADLHAYMEGFVKRPSVVKRMTKAVRSVLHGIKRRMRP